MLQGFRIPAENRISVSKLRDTHWQQRLILEHEDLNLISFFKLPRALLVIILSNWITLQTLCVFDTAVCERNSRKYLLQDILLDEGFVVPSNKLENLEENSTRSTQNAVLFARYLHFRHIFVKILDFTHWTFPILEINDFLKYLWHFDVDNERYRQIRALIIPKSALTFELANVVGSKLQNLWYLSLSGGGYALGDSEFKNLIFTCKHLTCLDISTCVCISSDAITFMARICVSLKHFIWQGHNTNYYVFICALGEYSKNLQLLDLSTQECQRFTDRDLGLINPKKHFQHLNYINLSGCDKLTEAGILFLVSSLTKLEYFSMCFERPGTGVWRGWDRPTPITDVCIVALSMNNPNLKELYLRGCVLITNNCMLPLSQKCKLLNHLDVTGSSCTPDVFDVFNKDDEEIIVMDENEQVPFYVHHLYVM